MTHNFAAMFADNAVANTQAQTGAFADVFGGKERIKNTFGIGNAQAAIAKRNLDERAGAGAPDLDAGGTRAFADGVVGIVEDVQKHLLDLVGISDDRGQGLVEAFDHLNAVTDEVVRTQVQSALQDGIKLDGLALRRPLAGKAEQILHDLLGALRFLQNHPQIAARAFGEFGIFHQEVGESEYGGQGIVDFVRDARDQLPDGCHFLRVHQLGAQHGGVGDVAHDHDDAADPAVLPADGTQIDGELAADSIAANQGHVEVIDLLSAGHGRQSVAERGAAGGDTQVGQGMTDDLVLLKAETAPAPVGITDDSVGVGDQDQALGVTQDFAGEIALFLQLGLRLVEAGDIQHEPAVLQDDAGRIAHGKTVHENVDGRSILTPEDFLVIAHFAAAFERFREFLPPLGREIDLGGNVELKQFVAAVVAEDANHGVVDFDESALRRRDVNSFLNVVEQFTIAALRFAAVGDVLKDVDGLPLGAAGAVNAGGGNQVSAFEDRMHIFVETFPGAAERTGVWGSAGSKGVQGAHVDADQVVGSYADEIGERAVDAKNVVLLVVDDDEVADGVEDFQPVAVGLLHTGKEAGILESDTGVTGDRSQQLPIFDAGRSATVGETKNTDKFSR